MKTANRLAVTLSTFTLLVGAATAHAAPSAADTEVVTKVVRFKDLDLETGAGAETLYERIAAAARVVCRGVKVGAVRECRTRAVEDAVRMVGNPLLSSVHRSASDSVAGVAVR